MPNYLRRQSIHDHKIDLTNFNRMVDIVNCLANISWSQDFTVMGSVMSNLGVALTPGATGGASSFDWSQFAYGCTVSGAIVTIQPGATYRAARPRFNYNGGTLTLTADYQYVVAAVDLLAASPATGFSLSLTEPQPTTDVWTFPLCRFRFIGGVGSLSRVHHVGDIKIDGAVG